MYLTSLHHSFYILFDTPEEADKFTSHFVLYFGVVEGFEIHRRGQREAKISIRKHDKYTYSDAIAFIMNKGAEIAFPTQNTQP